MTTSSLTNKILLGMLLGAAVGAALHPFAHLAWIQAYLSKGLFTVAGDIFITLLKMLVVPVAFISIVCGASSLANPKTMGALVSKRYCYTCVPLW